MPNKPAFPLTSGFKLREFLVRTNVLSQFLPYALSLGLILLVSMTNSAHATSQQISQKVTISVDPIAHTLVGSSQISIPAGTAVNFDFSELTISSLTIDGAAPATPLGDNATLTIDQANYEKNLSVDFSLTCTDAPSCMIDEAGIALTGSWLPTADKDTIFTLKATIPNGFEAISEADDITVVQQGKLKEVTFSFPHPVRAIHFIAGPYLLHEEPFADGQTLASYFFAEDEGLAASYRQKAKEYLERYIDQLGPYPYKRFAIVENRFPTGYAMPTFTLLGQSVVRLPFIVNTSLGHEVLHSWFGNAVRVDRNSGNWCEGLTTYLADQTYAADKGEDAVFRKNQLMKYQSYVNKDNALALDEFSGSNLGGSKEQQAIRAVGYGKSSMVFHMLHKKFGSDIFFRALRDFYNRMNGKIAAWQDIQLSFENTGASKLDSFFSQWLTRNDLPNISVQKLSLAERDGQLMLSFTLHQESENPYELTLPLVILTGSGTIDKSIELSKEDTAIEIPLAQYPIKMVIDQGYDTMRALNSSEFPPVWERFAGSQKSLAVVDSTADFDLFEPLIDHLEANGSKVLDADEITDKELSDNSVIFLGSKGAISRGLFAKVEHPNDGLTLDIRKNPLNHQHVAILASTANREETAMMVKRLRHYGKYSLLHFMGGRAVKKEIAPSATGQQYYLDEEPLAVAAPSALSFKTIIDDLNSQQVIYVGESHTRFEDHKIQLRVIRELFLANPNIAIGMEMFPRSSQATLDQFIHDEIDEKQFLKQSQYFKVWSYDYRLYREILNFARHNKIPIIALNIEKDKVSKVYKDGGISSLSPEEKMTIPVDRNLTMPYYRERLKNVFAMHPAHGGTPQFANFLQAQAIWDETMAESIVNYLSKNPTDKMVVLAGKAHVIKENAIPPRVQRRMPVRQSIIMSSDGGGLYPPEVDYLLFPPPAQLPQQLLMGIMMRKDQEKDVVIVDGLAAKGGAEMAGIKKDDILISLDDEAISSIEDVKIIMLFKKKGDVVKIGIERPHAIFPDEHLTFSITL